MVEDFSLEGDFEDPKITALREERDELRQKVATLERAVAGEAFKKGFLDPDEAVAMELYFGTRREADNFFREVREALPGLTGHSLVEH